MLLFYAFRLCVLLLLAALAAWSDVRSGKIGNRLVSAASLAGLAVNVMLALAGAEFGADGAADGAGHANLVNAVGGAGHANHANAARDVRDARDVRVAAAESDLGAAVVRGVKDVIIAALAGSEYTGRGYHAADGAASVDGGIGGAIGGSELGGGGLGSVGMGGEAAVARMSIALLRSLLGMLLPFFALFLLFKIRVLGAGDIKLMMAIGCIMGPVFSFEVLLYSFLAGGILALAAAILSGRLIERMNEAWQYIKSCVLLNSLLPYADALAKPDASAKSGALAKPDASAKSDASAKQAMSAELDASVRLGASAKQEASIKPGCCMPRPLFFSADSGCAIKFSIAIFAGVMANIAIYWLNRYSL